MTEVITFTKRERTLIENIRRLSPEKVVEVIDFVDFLSQREVGTTEAIAAAKLSEGAFQKVWNNPEDSDYDCL
ncbi:MAG: toxin-antitoxin system, antitoxin component, Xre family protein [Cyanobacteriota bacterium]|nr:toxin-antitoxin system, antitoxin component, Xre family protein [Cyanobacteriota bacterium]